MRTRITVLRELIEDSLYSVDERAVAEAIVLRARTRAIVPAPPFRSEHQRIRSFRRDPDARLFRLPHVDH